MLPCQEMGGALPQPLFPHELNTVYLHCLYSISVARLGGCSAQAVTCPSLPLQAISGPLPRPPRARHRRSPLPRLLLG